MKRTTFFILLLIYSFAPLWTQDLPSIFDHANELVETERKLDILSRSEARYTETKRITILNEESRANQFAVSYNPDNKIERIDADIYDLAGNKIRRVRKSEIRDVAAVSGSTLYQDYRVQHIELNHSQYPYVVEFSYTQKLKGILFAALPTWYFQPSNTSAVLRSSFEVTVREGLDINHRVYNIDLAPVVTTSDNSKTYRWEVEDIPAFSYEPYGIPSHRQLPLLRLSPQVFRIDKYNGSMESWADYGAFLYQLHQGRGELPAALVTTIESLTADAGSDTEKVAILYRYLQENKRYVSVQLGIGGWQPFSASYVEERGYGDCKALSNYMMSML
ncbi:MAG: DUF3857 domain-containing protein, partial [Bacteroidota bacterium]